MNGYELWNFVGKLKFGQVDVLIISIFLSSSNVWRLLWKNLHCLLIRWISATLARDTSYHWVKSNEFWKYFKLCKNNLFCVKPFVLFLSVAVYSQLLNSRNVRQPYFRRHCSEFPVFCYEPGPHFTTILGIDRNVGASFWFYYQPNTHVAGSIFEGTAVAYCGSLLLRQNERRNTPRS